MNTETKVPNPSVYPATTSKKEQGDNGVEFTDTDVVPKTGLTMLDYFAGLAMQGIITSTQGGDESAAGQAYTIAKAMLIERQKHL